MSIKKIKIFLLAPILMAFQCSDDDNFSNTKIFNNYNVEITPQSSFSINDTIWINGKISSMVFDTEINDSIFSNPPLSDAILVMKFIAPTNSSSFNCKDAIDKFELIPELGGLTFLPVCENAQMSTHSELSADSTYYSHRIGLKPLYTGDYVLSWHSSSLTNQNRNEYIFYEYQLDLFPNDLGFNKCGSQSWINAVESDHQFYFRVE